MGYSLPSINGLVCYPTDKNCQYLPFYSFSNYTWQHIETLEQTKRLYDSRFWTLGSLLYKKTLGSWWVGCNNACADESTIALGQSQWEFHGGFHDIKYHQFCWYGKEREWWSFMGSLRETAWLPRAICRAHGKRRLCRVSKVQRTAKSWAHGKAYFCHVPGRLTHGKQKTHGKASAMPCARQKNTRQTKNTRQRLHVCRVLHQKHTAKCRHTAKYSPKILNLPLQLLWVTSYFMWDSKLYFGSFSWSFAIFKFFISRNRIS